MSTATIEFTEADIPAAPDDIAPATEEVVSTTGDYDPLYPGSTPEAPYGYKADGTAYKRRPNKGYTRRESGSGRIVASESQAKAAAAMLAQVNNLVCISIHVAGMPRTATSIQEQNAQFEAMAFEALLTDPALCKKILMAGANSGKAALLMAYATLGMSAVPAAISEVKERRNNDEQE